MKKTFFFLFILSCFLNAAGKVNSIPNPEIVINENENLGIPPAVVCERKSGRTGDRLIAFIGARWSAHKYNMAFFYRPFPYSSQICLSDHESVFNEKLAQKYTKSKEINYAKLANFYPENDTLYIWNNSTSLNPNIVKEMRADPSFIALLRKLIAPKYPKKLNIVTPPKEIFSVAVHIRTGVGVDGKLASVQLFNQNKREKVQRTKSKSHPDVGWPMKFPPKQYYIDQIKYLSELRNHEKMYLYIFTDDPKGEDLKNLIQKNVNLPNIIFDCRKIETGRNNLVLDDLFSILNFDALIRPGCSHFSEILSLIGDFKVAIYPKKSHWEKDEMNRYYLIMDNVIVEEKDAQGVFEK